MKVMLFQTDGNALAKELEAEEGVTLGEFLMDQGITDDNTNLVRLNRAPAAANTELSNGDKISVTPRNIKGA